MEQLTTQQLKDKINNKENFVLDLYANWCGPCRVMLENLKKVNQSLITESDEPKYKIYKFDIDTDKEFVVNELNIRSVPTLKIYQDGREVFSKPGVMSPNDVLNLLN